MKSALGIDIGTRFVKVVQIQHQKKSRILQAFVFPLPVVDPNTVTPFNNINKQEFSRQILSRIPLANLKDADIGVNIPLSMISVLTVQLPKMNSQEMSTAAVAEARRKMLPMPGPESVFEHALMGELLVAKIPQMEVVIVKTEKKHVSALLDLFNSFSGRELNFISPTCHTLMCLLPQNSEENQKDTAFIDIGYDSMNITIAQRGHLYFNRNIKFGLREMITYIAESLHISFEKAESLLREVGGPQAHEDLKDQKNPDPKESSSQTVGLPMEGLRIICETISNRILHEIRRTGTHYKEQSAGRRIENFFFLGGGSKIKGLVSNLVNQIGGNCKIINPAQEMNISLEGKQAPPVNEDEWPLFAGALSIAMSLPVIRQKQTINFLPLELKRKHIIIYRQIGLLFLSFFIMFLLGIAGGGLFLNNQFVKNAIQKLEDKARPARNVLEKFDQLQREKEKRMAEISGIQKISLEKKDMASLLDEIVRCLPQKVHLTKLSIEQKKTDSMGAPPPPSKTASAGDQPPDPASQGMGGMEKGGLSAMNAGGNSSNKESTPFKQYTVDIQAVCVVDYEEVLKLAQEFKKGLEQSGQFINVVPILPKIETIIPVIDSQEEVQLTQPQERKFSIQAEVRR